MLQKADIVRVDQNSINDWLSMVTFDQLIVLADSRVWDLYKDSFRFDSKNYKLVLWECASGEACKDINHYSACVNYILSQGIHRYAYLLAIGGGATTDFAGFVASTLLRGITWGAIPTSLLAMVDAAIGGKTGLNTSAGKNLVGTFFPPETVWLCPEFLKTLSDDELKSGMGEVLKYCMLSTELYEAVIEHRSVEEIIDLCARYKQQIVDIDPNENGLRRMLNYGHTFGHAFERTFHYKHGVSVVLGIAFILHLFDANSSIRGELQALTRLLGLDFVFELYNSSMQRLASDESTLNSFLSLVDKDKKKTTNSSIEIVLINKIGHPERRAVNSNDLLESSRNMILNFTQASLPQSK